MIFKPAARYPADPRAVFVLVVTVTTSVLALMLKAQPNTLHAALPRWQVATWAVLLTVGSLLTLLGMARQTVDGIIAEQIGCVMVGVTTIGYSALALAQVGPSGLQTIGIILGWGIACFIRWGQLQSLLKNAQRRAEKREILDRLEADLIARGAMRGKP